jgi:hypothetical protein
VTIRNGNGISIRLITFVLEDEENARRHVNYEIKIKNEARKKKSFQNDIELNYRFILFRITTIANRRKSQL